MELYNGDCMDVMEKMINNGVIVDCIIVDPPYNINYQKWDNNFNIKKAIDLSIKLIKPGGNIIIFQGWSEVSNTIQYIYERESEISLTNWIIWDRIKGRGASKQLVSTREDILWVTKKGSKYTFNKIDSNIPKKTKGMGEKKKKKNRALTNVWYDISPIVPWSKERNGHPTQKPLQLMERIVTLWSNEGDVVLDFCMGSGSTGEACNNLNREFIGIEKDEKWFEYAKGRLYGNYKRDCKTENEES